jgi:DNA modification methylase
MTAVTDDYVTDEAEGPAWRMLLGDSCERLAELGDETVDLSVYSPPFASLFTYSPSPRDLGNSASRDEFHAHYRYVINELYRVTKPGRNSCVHVADIATSKTMHGVTGLYDLPGAVIAAHVAAGWTFYGRWWVDKNPQAVAQRTKAMHLLFATKNRDSAASAPAAGDQLLLFRKPGDNAVPILTDVTNEEWISFARPCWTDIRETYVLQSQAAREDADERHLHCLQLDFIVRCIRMWSNPSELVVSPFGGVGSEPWAAVSLGRRAWACELKPSYWAQAVKYLRALDDEMALPTLFDEDVSA